MIYACMSRRMLMGDDLAELEFDFYEKSIPMLPGLMVMVRFCMRKVCVDF